MVDRELTLDFEQLVGRDLIERDITLACVSNEVGGGYVGNARWVGRAARGRCSKEAGVDPAADQLVSHGRSTGSRSGRRRPWSWTVATRCSRFAMNGEPLPIEHGFPVRMVVPGLYGYVSATKWVVELELTTFDAFDPYWIQRGWAEQAPIKTQSRIDTPKPLATVPPRGAVDRRRRVGAAARHRTRRGPDRRGRHGSKRSCRPGHDRHVATVALRVERSTPGNHTMQVRATDATGRPDRRSRRAVPDGATGQHQLVVTVTSITRPQTSLPDRMPTRERRQGGRIRHPATGRSRA